MARDWQAREVEAMITLIDDPRHKVTATGAYRLSAEQAKAILDLRLQRLTALGRDEIQAESTSSPTRSPTISTFCARAPASRPSSRTSSPP